MSTTQRDVVEARPWMSYLGTILVELGALTDADLAQALERQRETGRRLGTILIDEGYITEDELVSGLAQQLNIPIFDHRQAQSVDPQLATAIPEMLARRHHLLPVALDEETITVAMADPVNLVAIDDVTTVTQRVVRPLVGRDQDISLALDRLYESASTTGAVEDALARVEVSTEKDDVDDVDVNQLLRAADDAPIVRLVNSVIMKAIQERATDIHIEPLPGQLLVRYRVDGVLYDTFRPPRKLHPALVSRIKVLADLDIAERRLPQDGRFSVRVRRSNVDVRVSVLPTVNGEKVVLRLLDKTAVELKLEKLGFRDRNLVTVRETIHKPWGMLLVSGPTGSGKTTTLYAALSELVGPSINITTIEDPVEYHIDRLNQVQVLEKSGLTFSRALRSFLRQDPDVIMVGEIRDGETAEIAVRAALTGHFVLSTIHANDAVTTATRLIDIGVEPYLVASALSLVLAQRLVRRLCAECKVADTEETAALIALGVPPERVAATPHWKSVGCPACRGRGYVGRLAIHEALLMTRGVRQLIASGAPVDEIRAAAASEGMETLKDSGLVAIREGLTTPAEVVRVALDSG